MDGDTHLRLQGTSHPRTPFRATQLGFVPLSAPYRGLPSLGMQQLPPAHTQAVIHRQEVSSWWSLPDLQVGLVPMGTVGSRQVKPRLPRQLLGTEQGWQSRGTEHTPTPGTACSQGQVGAMQGRSRMGGSGGACVPGSILVLVGIYGCISRAVGATGQSGHRQSHSKGVSSMPGGGQSAGGDSGWAGLESRSQQGYQWLAEGHGCMGRAEAGVRGPAWKTTSAGHWLPRALQVAVPSTASLPFSGHW